MAAVPKRRDAVANQERVLQAALELFVERGLEVPIPEIAERAGVGKATVYRSFPTKADLVAAVALMRMEIARERVEHALEFDDPFEGFRWYVEQVLVLQAHDRALGDAMRNETRPDVAQARAEILACVDKLLRRAAKEGKARRDASSNDLRVFLGGVALQLTRMDVTDEKIWKRYAALIVDVFRA